MSDLSPDQIRRQAIAEELELAYERVKEFPENNRLGFIKLIELRNLIPDVIGELRRGIPRTRSDGMQKQFRFER